MGSRAGGWRQSPEDLNLTTGLAAIPAVSSYLLDYRTNSTNAIAAVVDHDLPVFFGKRPTMRQRQNVEDGLRRAAQFDAPRRHDHRSIDQNGVSEHLVDEFVVRPVRRA